MYKHYRKQLLLCITILLSALIYSLALLTSVLAAPNDVNPIIKEPSGKIPILQSLDDSGMPLLNMEGYISDEDNVFNNKEGRLTHQSILNEFKDALDEDGKPLGGKFTIISLINLYEILLAAGVTEDTDIEIVETNMALSITELIDAGIGNVDDLKKTTGVVEDYLNTPYNMAVMLGTEYAIHLEIIDLSAPVSVDSANPAGPLISITIASALYTYSDSGISYAEIQKRALDPQSWQLQRDRTWEHYRPNPVIDWKTEMNPQGIVRPNLLRNPQDKTPIAGALIMIEYLDRKFISRGKTGSDPLGYYLYNTNGSGLSDSKTNNPIYNVPQLIADEKYNGDTSFVTDEEFAQWWADYLNKPQEINHGLTIDEAWRENSYGKWAIDLTPYGPYTIPYFEFETMAADVSFQSYNDVPPSFRNKQGNSYLSTIGFSFDTVSAALIDDLVLEGKFDWDDVDFFFWLHAGYDESGVWQEFGINQFPTRKDIPYELGPGPRMKTVEKFFTQNPAYLSIYAARYNGATSTIITDTGSMRVADFWANERDKYATLAAAGTPELYEFKLSASDWAWVESYNGINVKNTRYVDFTCWEAAVGEWGHMGSIKRNGRDIRYSNQGENDGMSAFAHEFGHITNLADNYGNPFTGGMTPLTEPWELMSRGTFAGPFGDHARWTVPGIEAATVPVHFMQRNKAVSNYFDNNDLLTVSKQELTTSPPVIAEIVARNIPLNNNKNESHPEGLYPSLEEYGLVSPYFYKGINLIFGSSPYHDSATRYSYGFSNFRQSAAIRMHVEVVQRTGYDSYAPDDGVIISRTSNMTNNSVNNMNYTSIIDSHNYDIAMIDYTVSNGFGEGKDDHVSYTTGHSAQLWDAAFHAGTSFTDTGYYRTIYGPASDDIYRTDKLSQSTITNSLPTYITRQEGPRYYYNDEYGVIWQKAISKPGSIMQWEKQDGREIASGETVNEWYDPYNKLHFYILAKNTHKGKYDDFLSYTVGVLHDDGSAVEGNLELILNYFEPAIQGNYAVAHFTLEQSGANATDIIRISLDGLFASSKNALLLNNLYALENGKISFEVYILAEYGNLTTFPVNYLNVIVSSESNSDKEIAFIHDANITITTQPNAQSAFDFNSITGNLSIEAIIDPERELYYQWCGKTTADSTESIAIEGADSASFAIPKNLTPGSHYYYCVVSAAGAIPMRSHTATVTVNAVISISEQPAPTVNVIQNNIDHILSIKATVDPPPIDLSDGLHYQWYSKTSADSVDSMIIEGANSSSYAIPKTLTPGTYFYFCEISTENAITLKSNTATVIVRKPDNTNSSHPSNNNNTTAPPQKPEITDSISTNPTYQPQTPLHPAGTRVEATKTKDPLFLNDKEYDFPALKVSGYNWLKLRDLAMIINGTPKQFSLTYDPATRIIDISISQPYTPLGDELEDLLDDVEDAISTSQRIRVNGSFVDVAAYNVKGYNYFRLRDLAIILDFLVDYDPDTTAVTLDLSQPYSEPE